jgi:hypothetical protein
MSALFIDRDQLPGTGSAAIYARRHRVARREMARHQPPNLGVARQTTGLPRDPMVSSLGMRCVGVQEGALDEHSVGAERQLLDPRGIRLVVSRVDFETDGCGDGDASYEARKRPLPVTCRAMRRSG